MPSTRSSQPASDALSRTSTMAPRVGLTTRVSTALSKASEEKLRSILFDMCEQVPGADDFVRQRCVQKPMARAPEDKAAATPKTLSQGNLSKLQQHLGNSSPLAKDPDTLAVTNDTPKRKIDVGGEFERSEPKRRAVRQSILASKGNRRKITNGEVCQNCGGDPYSSEGCCKQRSMDGYKIEQAENFLSRPKKARFAATVQRMCENCLGVFSDDDDGCCKNRY
ncbi:hypothetical protein HYALB_00011324 [Hymenoscyphus albidus]|uniref:Uncharacterized protein n=1 Tax=Hymenoscyphus albidus TaxID=595503 RepID=A0A9N9LDJ5_9HELO|nr:hypothetical protein HYALB_00011324 [Hymenoscyphus albidus]